MVSSCDKYAACWAPFCHGLQKYWPEHPEKLVFITNYKQAPCGETWTMGEDRGWANNLLAALDQVDTDYILYAQEDYWIKSTVPDKDIRDYMGYLESGQPDMIRLYPAPGPDKDWEGDERLGVIADKAEYRASLQMALWRKTTLQALIKKDETPWQFEVKGTERSRQFGERFLCVRKRRFGIDYVFTAIVNGYWSKLAYAYANLEELEIPFDSLQQKPITQKVYDFIRLIGYKIRRKYFEG